MRQKLQVLVHNAVEIKSFIVISLMEQILFKMAPTDIRTKLLLNQSGR